MHVCFRLFSVPVTCPAKDSFDTKILETFSMEQTWPSCLSVEVRVSKICSRETLHSHNVVVETLVSFLDKIQFSDFLVYSVYATN